MIKRLLGESVRGSQKKPAEDEQEAETEEALTHFEIIVCCEDEPRQSQTESQLSVWGGEENGGEQREQQSRGLFRAQSCVAAIPRNTPDESRRHLTKNDN